MPVRRSFLVESIRSYSRIDEKKRTKLFRVFTDYFILSCLETFNDIIGLDMLKSLNALIDLEKSKIIYDGDKEAILNEVFKDVDHFTAHTTDVPNNIRKNFEHMMRRNIGAFADPDGAFPYNTNVVAAI